MVRGTTDGLAAGGTAVLGQMDPEAHRVHARGRVDVDALLTEAMRVALIRCASQDARSPADATDRLVGEQRRSLSGREESSGDLDARTHQRARERACCRATATRALGVRLLL